MLETIDPLDKDLNQIFDRFDSYATGNKIAVGDIVYVVELRANEFSGYKKIITVRYSDTPREIEDIDFHTQQIWFAGLDVPFTGRTINQLRMWKQIILFNNKNDFDQCIMLLHLFAPKQGEWEIEFKDSIVESTLRDSKIMKKINEGWVKENPNSQEKIRRDNKGKKVKTPDGLGSIKYEMKTPTFSQMVPYKHEIFVALDSGKSKIFDKAVVKVVKDSITNENKTMKKTKLTEAPIHPSLLHEFYTELKSNSEFFRDWKNSGSDLVKQFDDNSALGKKLTIDAIEALKELGWVISEKTGFDVIMERNKRWPIKIRNMHRRVAVYIFDDGNNDDLYAAMHMLTRVLTKAGIKVQPTSVKKYVKVDRTGKTAKGIANLVQSALDADMQINRPLYIENPWCNAGKSMVFPGSVNSYEVTAGKLRFTVAVSWDKGFIDLMGDYSDAGWRSTKDEHVAEGVNYPKFEIFRDKPNKWYFNVKQDGRKYGPFDSEDIALIAAKKKVSNMDESKTMKKTKVTESQQSFSVDDPALAKVLRHFQHEISVFQMGGDLDDHLYNALYDFWFDDMPYGTKKARDGDPYEWISDKLANELGNENFTEPTVRGPRIGDESPRSKSADPYERVFGIKSTTAEGAAGDIMPLEEQGYSDDWYNFDGRMNPNGAYDAAGHYFPERDADQREYDSEFDDLEELDEDSDDRYDDGERAGAAARARMIEKNPSLRISPQEYDAGQYHKNVVAPMLAAQKKAAALAKEEDIDEALMLDPNEQDRECTACDGTGEGAAGECVFCDGSGVEHSDDFDDEDDFEELDESGMSSLDLLMQDLGKGIADIYDVMSSPSTPIEHAASDILQKMYDEVSIDHRLHPDDDFEEIIDIMAEQIAKDYPTEELDEAGYSNDQLAAIRLRSASDANVRQQVKGGVNVANAQKQPSSNVFSPMKPSTSVSQPGSFAANRKDFRQGLTLDEEEMTEAFLVEENEDLISEILENLGLVLDEDFLFEHGELYAIGKTTALVIKNALDADSRIGGSISIGEEDGAQVQIVFGQEIDDTDDYGTSEVMQDRMFGEEVDLDNTVTEDVNLNITANGEDDVLNVIKRLSGLNQEPTIPSITPTVEIIKPQFEPSISDLLGRMDNTGTPPGAVEVLGSMDADGAREFADELDSAEQSSKSFTPSMHDLMSRLTDIGSSEEVKSKHFPGDTHPNDGSFDDEDDFDELDEELDTEYDNSPDATMYMSNDEMMNQGDKNQRGMNGNGLGNNKMRPVTVDQTPIKESNKLMTQYSQLLAQYKK
jgi:hypothetical protein